MKIGICDDIAEEREHIETLCHELGYSDLYLYASGEELLNSPELPSLTLLFLDIEMDGISGIEIKNKLELSTTFIVFCTTHQDKINSAFGRNVIFFLTKPLTKDAVNSVIRKAAFLSRDFFQIRLEDSDSIACRDILYLKTEQKYTVFHTIDKGNFSSRKPMKSWASELSELGFCPVSRSAVINLKYYQRQDKNLIFLRDGITIPISRRYLQLLKEANNSYAQHLMGL